MPAGGIWIGTSGWTHEDWRDQTPKTFLFAWKASKFITHWKRLSDNSVNSIELMETRLKELGSKVGPVLFQLPARFNSEAFITPKRQRGIHQ